MPRSALRRGHRPRRQPPGRRPSAPPPRRSRIRSPSLPQGPWSAPAGPRRTRSQANVRSPPVAGRQARPGQGHSGSVRPSPGAGRGAKRPLWTAMCLSRPRLEPHLAGGAATPERLPARPLGRAPATPACERVPRPRPTGLSRVPPSRSKGPRRHLQTELSRGCPLRSGWGRHRVPHRPRPAGRIPPLCPWARSRQWFPVDQGRLWRDCSRRVRVPGAQAPESFGAARWRHPPLEFPGSGVRRRVRREEPPGEPTRRRAPSHESLGRAAQRREPGGDAPAKATRPRARPLEPLGRAARGHAWRRERPGRKARRQELGGESLGRAARGWLRPEGGCRLWWRGRTTLILPRPAARRGCGRAARSPGRARCRWAARSMASARRIRRQTRRWHRATRDDRCALSRERATPAGPRPPR